MVNNRKHDLLSFGGLVALILVLNVLSSYFHTRFDFTQEKRYTVSPVTRQLLGGLNQPVYVTVYLEGDFPAGFKRLRNAARDLLSDFSSYSNGNLHFQFVNPAAGNQAEQEEVYRELAGKGIDPTNLSVKTEDGLSQKIIFPGALVRYQGQEVAVRLLLSRMGAGPEEILNNSIQNLEYAFASAIKKATSGGKPRVGITEGHGELSDLQLSDAMKSLSDGFEVGRVDLRTISLAGLRKVRLLVVAKPDIAFSEAEKYKIDYFIMHGGRVLWALDNVNAELDSLRGQGAELAFAKKLNLDDMLFRYGARVNYDLIADMNCAQIPLNVGRVGGQGQIQMVPWLFYPIFVPMVKHPLVKNLDGIRSEFASSVDTLPVKGVKKTVILSSSPFSRLMKIPGMISLEMVQQEPDPQEFRGVALPVGALLEGSFPSDFTNRAVPAGVGEAAPPVEQSVATKMIVVGDGDILKNQVNNADGSPFPLGYDRYTQQQYGNKNFLLNAADYLTEDSRLIELRNKEIRLRLLDRAKIKEEKAKWQMINLVAPLVLLMLFGIFQHYYRRQKYAS